jgi:hypothetical protein
MSSFLPTCSFRFSLFHKIFVAAILISFFLAVRPVDAQTFSLGISKYYPIDGDVSEGDIIVVYDGKYQKTMLKYQPNIIGIYVENPAFEVRPTDKTGQKPVISSGEIYVNATTSNGVIKRSDYLTSSDVPGVAMLADKRGPVIGTALEDYTESDTSKVGKIKVNVYIQDTSVGAFLPDIDTSVNFFDIFSASKLALYESPSDSFKYIVAATVVIISFIFGFITFRKVAVKGVEAIGRNPLASKAIGVGILLNLLITVSIIIAGLVLAYFVVTL